MLNQIKIQFYHDIHWITISCDVRFFNTTNQTGYLQEINHCERILHIYVMKRWRNTKKLIGFELFCKKRVKSVLSCSLKNKKYLFLLLAYLFFWAIYLIWMKSKSRRLSNKCVMLCQHNKGNNLFDLLWFLSIFFSRRIPK